jgi:4-amino-4-deoxy-L-arabinose transferase-like glycosyltransferase
LPAIADRPARAPRPTLAGNLAVVLCALGFGSVGLAYPFGRDQGNYAYAAWVWLEGAMPYRDVYVFKPPGTVWVHALAQALFGHSMSAIRILDVAWTVATALVLADTARRWFRSELTAALAGIFYAFLYANVNFWSTAQTDGWVNLPALLAVWLVTRAEAQPSSRGELRSLPLAGALLGVAICLKYTALVLAAPAGVLLLATPRALPRRLALMAAGVVAVLGVTLAWLHARGAIAGFVDSQLVLVPAYVEQTGRGIGAWGRIAGFSVRLWKLPELRFALLSMLVGIAPLVRRLRGTEARLRSLAALTLLVAGAASCFAQNKFFTYHYLTLLPGAALLGALGIAGAYGALAPRSRLGAGTAAAVVIVALIATSHYPSRWATLGRLAAGSLTLAKHWRASAYAINQMSARDNLAAAEWIARETSPTDRVFLWGFDPMVNYLARRRTVSRFLYNYPLVVPWGGAKYEGELLDALKASPPRLFVVGSQDATPSVTGSHDDSRAQLQRFAGLTAFLGSRYDFAADVGRFGVYRLRSGEGR